MNFDLLLALILTLTQTLTLLGHTLLTIPVHDSNPDRNPNPELDPRCNLFPNPNPVPWTRWTWFRSQDPHQLADAYMP